MFPQTGNTPSESLIAEEDTLEGQLRTQTGVRVLGTVRGTIESERSVRIDAGAQVEADITAEEVVIAGTFSGNITCRTRVEITASGRATGTIDTAKIYIHEGGFVDGTVQMGRSGDGTARTGEGDTSRTGEGETGRPRRSRYVDLAAETPGPTPVAENDTEPTTVGS